MSKKPLRYAPHTLAMWFASIGMGTTRSVESATISPDVAHTSHFWFKGEKWRCAFTCRERS